MKFFKQIEPFSAWQILIAIKKGKWVYMQDTENVMFHSIGFSPDTAPCWEVWHGDDVRKSEREFHREFKEIGFDEVLKLVPMEYLCQVMTPKDIVLARKTLDNVT